MAEENERVQADARIDEVQGIDKSEQSGIGGEASVLEDYGIDTVQDDLPEPEDLPNEPILPGSDKDSDDLEVAGGDTSDTELGDEGELSGEVPDAAGRKPDAVQGRGLAPEDEAEG